MSALSAALSVSLVRLEDVMAKVKEKVVPRPERPDQWSIRTGTDWIINDRIQSALVDYDRKRDEVEKVWGVDRLPDLVSDETRAKWWRAVGALNQAIYDGDANKVRSLVNNLVAGFDKLVAEALERGGRQLEPDIWQTKLEDGRTLQIVRTWPERAYRADKDPQVLTYTLEEIGRLVASLPLLNAVKKQWPGATVEKPVSPLSKELNDDIPW
jgi:hypothetical protein